MFKWLFQKRRDPNLADGYEESTVAHVAGRIKLSGEVVMCCEKCNILLQDSDKIFVQYCAGRITFICPRRIPVNCQGVLGFADRAYFERENINFVSKSISQ